MQAEWLPGVSAMSNAVSSVISDYATGLDHVRTEDVIDDRYRGDDGQSYPCVLPQTLSLALFLLVVVC